MARLQIIEYQSAARVPARRIELPELPHLGAATYASSGNTPRLEPETRLVTLRALEGDWSFELRADGARPPLESKARIQIREGESMSFGIRQELVGLDSLCFGLSLLA